MHDLVRMVMLIFKNKILNRDSGACAKSSGLMGKCPSLRDPSMCALAYLFGFYLRLK